MKRPRPLSPLAFAVLLILGVDALGAQNPPPTPIERARPLRDADGPDPQRRRVTRVQTLTAAEIQAALDADGYFFVPPGTHRLERPLRLRAGQRLTGGGIASTLQYDGRGDVALYFGEREAYNYGCYLDNLQIVGGSVVCERFGQHCAIEKVWIVKSPAEGLLVDGIGDKMVFRDVVCYQSRGIGIAVRSRGSNNGLLFDHCNSQSNGGEGLVLETVAPNGLLNMTVVRDCTIQGNGADGRTRAEVIVRGYVAAPRFENVWIENSTLRVGLRSEASVAFEQPDGRAPLVRRPSRVLFTGNSTIAGPPRAIEFADCYECEIDQLNVTPATARVIWKSAPDRERNSTYTTKPRLREWILKPAQIVADPELE